MSPSPPRSLAVRGICQALSTVPGQWSGRRQTTFYGSGFIADQTGAVVAKAGREGQEVVLASFNLGAIADLRASGARSGIGGRTHMLRWGRWTVGADRNGGPKTAAFFRVSPRSAVTHIDIIALRFADIQLARAADFQGRVGDHFFPLRNPANGAR